MFTLPRVLHMLLAGILLNPILVPVAADQQQHVLSLSSPNTLSFQLRHVHATTNRSSIIFQNIDEHLALNFNTLDPASRFLRTRPISVPRLHYPASRSASLGRGEFGAPLGWNEKLVHGPDLNDRGTILELAKMTSNAYEEKKTKDWYELGDGWEHEPFGWEPDADGFRGHVFVSTDNSTVVLTIKGTSAAWPAGPGGPSRKKDKLNDNLLFSCCCAKVGPTWSPVCDCYRGASKCDWNCLEQAVAEDSLFYGVGLNLYNNLTYMYPDAEIWLTGHSLGGSLASLIGVTFGAPVVAFEAPGEALAARRLHLPNPPSTQHIRHFYHNADPIPMGVCTGTLSSCAVAGYALETSCHLGQSSIFDTVNELGWSVDVRTHGIVVVIEKLLNETSEWFAPSTIIDKKTGERITREPRKLPDPTWEGDKCLEQECFAWEFI